MLYFSTKTLNNQKKLLKNKANHLKIKRFIQLGELFEKAGFDILDEKLEAPLLGALLQIRESFQNSENLKSFTSTAKDYNSNTLQKYAISFAGPAPTEEAVKALEALKFRWRESLQEWHGRAKQKDLAKLLDHHKGIVEAVK